MTRRLKQPLPAENSMLYATNAIVQIKVWLLGVSPIVWRRVLVPSDATPRELHGVFPGGGGLGGDPPLSSSCLRTARYGSGELSVPRRGRGRWRRCNSVRVPGSSTSIT